MNQSRKGATILVVEDNDMVRPFVVQSLRHQGFRVVEAEDGESGLSLYERHRRQIDLVLTDLIMPKMNGLEMIRAILQHDPSANIVVMSGTFDLPSSFASATGLRFQILRKPFTASSLEECVTKFLAAA